MKKREILPTLNNAIAKLSMMSGDAAKLEYTDNDQASKRLKADLSDFVHNELKVLQSLVYAVRTDITISGKTRKRKVVPPPPKKEEEKIEMIRDFLS